MTPADLATSANVTYRLNVQSGPCGTATIRELIDQRAAVQPESSFLISPETGQALTFEGLQEQSQLLSAQLREWGLEPGDKVALLMDNGVFAAQVFLGAMYGGFVSVPLNVRGGVAQLSYMLAHCDAKVLFVGDEYTGLAAAALQPVTRTIRMIPARPDACSSAGGSVSRDGSSMAPAPEDVALLMYTSGSTGNPKAAVHTHRTILAGGRNSVAAHELSSSDRSLLVLPLYHINAECVTLIPTLLSGGSVVVPQKFAVRHFWDWMEEYGCTWSAVVPTIVSQLLDWPDPQAAHRAKSFRRIRFLRSSSAPLAPSLHREFLAKFPVLLIQAMGSSEGGNIFSNPQAPRENKIGSPGLPWGFEVKIVNRHGAEVPHGEPGEMLIRGEALTCNYYKEPEATAAAFDAEGWLHTGDLAYRDPDGYFFVVGRSKELIIKGGVNIAPRHIDDVLESHPAVLEAAAVGVPDRLLGEDVVAFVVLRAGASCDEREILTLCESRLGHFKTPTRIHFAEDLPKGPSGKVQRLRLVEEAAALTAAGLANTQTGFALARGNDGVIQNVSVTLPTSLENIIAGIWTELLKLPNVGLHDNFFALGGDSLAAIQCVSRLRDKVAVRLSLTDIFANGSVAELATLIREKHDTALHQAGMPHAPAPGADSIPTRDRTQPYRLSPLQERLWFMELLNPGLPVYNEAEAVRLKGNINFEALERALNAVIARHETLRTTVRMKDGVALAAAQQSYALRIKRIGLTALDAGQREAEVDRLLNSEPRIPYHLQDEPAIRATLIQLGPAEHVFILMMHHLICDWSSEGALWRDLAIFYRSYCHGESVTLPAPSVQYGDYALWQRGQATQAALAEDLAYWKENLKAAPPLLELPSDRPRPQVNSYSGARRRFRISSAITKAFRQLSRQEKKSLFALFTAALDILLYRYTGQEDILLGVPIAERDRPELQSMIGFLLHTHVLRTQVSGDLTYRELAAQVQQAALKLYEHRSAPFDQVVRAVQPERSLSYSPLFQVMVNWRDRDQHLSFIGLEGLEVESLIGESGTSKFDLTLFLTDMGEEIWAEIEYSTDLFDDSRIARLFDHYQVLLTAIAANPEQPIRKLPLLTDAELNQLLVEWNETKVDYPVNARIHHLFEHQARLSPEAPAVEFDGRLLSYRELDDRASRLAHYLRQKGVGPETLVGVSMKRNADLVVALLAILKADGAYLPLDPAYPPERISFILDETQTPLVLTQKNVVASLPSFAGEFVCVDDPGLQAEIANLETDHAQSPKDRHDASQLCYVLFTSGSTGKPKGVEICHRAVVNFLQSMAATPGINRHDTLLSVTTPSFDIFGLEVWLPLTTGAKVVIAPEDVTKDGRELASLMARCDATVMQATPATWGMLLDAGWEGKRDLKALCGGEAWPSDLAERLLSKCAELWNMYGPTETTIWSAVHRVEPLKPVLIGRPIANTQFYVVDSRLQLTPIGTAGELMIGGDGLARGYWDRPELTAEKFVSAPFCADERSRVYRTGDLVRHRADGTLEFLGRIDHQVKIRGFRIELGEIESVLSSHPEVAKAVVVARGDREKQLVAYVVLAPASLITTAELREYLHQKLPSYMIPAAFVTLPEFPLTPNGKIDRKALPAPGPAGIKAQVDSGVPRDILEQQLTRVWERILGVRPIGLKDDFFDLGGHSLLAAQLFSEIAKLTGKNLPLATLFQAPTVGELAEILRKDGWTPSWSSLVPIKPGGSQLPLFLVHGAEGNVLLYRQLARHLGPDQPVYGFQSQGLSGEGRFHQTIEEMAAHYVKELVALQPSGPYRLGGYCLGGVIAFEMAKQIEARGERVAMVAMLETYNINASPQSGRFPALVHSLQGMWFHGANFYLAGNEDRWKFFNEKWAMALTRAGNRLDALHWWNRPVARRVAPHQMAKKVNHSAAKHYVPAPQSVRVVVFRPKRGFWGRNDPSFGWRTVVGEGLAVREIPIYPRGMLVEPFIQKLAQELGAYLKEAI